MIKAKAKNTMILGLSDENVQRLQKGEPIKFNMKSIGFPDIEVLIFHGKTEAAMEMTMRQSGMIHPTKTVMHSDNAKDN